MRVVVVRSVDQHHIVEAIVLPVPAIGDLLGAVSRERVAVEPGEVADIDDVLDVVQPIRIDVTDLDALGAVLHAQHVVERQQWRRGGAEIAEDEPAEFLDGIARESDLILEAAALGLGRLLKALAIPRVEPAMIRAANRITLDAAVIEREATMGAA